VAQRGPRARHLVRARLPHHLQRRLGMPLQNLLVSEAHQRLIRSGRPEVVPMPAGQIVGRITEVRTVAAVMADLVQEAGQTLEKLTSLR